MGPILAPDPGFAITFEVKMRISSFPFPNSIFFMLLPKVKLGIRTSVKTKKCTFFSIFFWRSGLDPNPGEQNQCGSNAATDLKHCLKHTTSAS